MLVGMAGASTDDERLRLIQVSETETPKWLTQDKVNELLRQKVHFMDITDSSRRPIKKLKLRSRGKLCCVCSLYRLLSVIILTDATANRGKE